MPVEIKKMVVKATVVKSTRNTAYNKRKQEGFLLLNEKEKQLIIEESVQQVLAILERKKAR